MRIRILLMIKLLLLIVCCSTISKAQVPNATEKEITGFLKQQPGCRGLEIQFNVQAVKIGPGKSGFIGSCLYGGGISVLYEQSSQGLKRLLQVKVQMNGGVDPINKAYKGYYDISVWGRSGNEFFGTIYRWNGQRYIKYKSNL